MSEKQDDREPMGPRVANTLDERERSAADADVATASAPGQTMPDQGEPDCATAGVASRAPRQAAADATPHDPQHAATVDAAPHDPQRMAGSTNPQRATTATTPQHAAPCDPQRPRHRRALLVAAALMAVLLAAQTISFMVSSINIQGFVAFGAVQAQVEETMLDASGNEVAVPAEAEQIDAVRAASRIVRVRNTGDEPVFVRVRLSITGSAAAGNQAPAPQPADDLATYQLGAGWVERGGWYYLPAPLEPGALSDPVITGIDFDQLEAQRRFPNGTLSFDATAQYVQVDNNAATSLEAEGWPNGDE